MAGPQGVPVPYRWEPKAANDTDARAFNVGPDPLSSGSVGWLGSITGDTIAVVAATVAPAVYGGLTVVTVTFVGSIITVWLSGGIEGQSYVVILTVTTAAGRTKNFPIQISVPAVATILTGPL